LGHSLFFASNKPYSTRRKGQRPFTTTLAIGNGEADDCHARAQYCASATSNFREATPLTKQAIHAP
jgi:hypothetical protein